MPAPVERIVLLPHADGSPSSVVVLSAHGELVLDHGYSEAEAEFGRRSWARR